jgi:hypothetical protein
MVLEWEGERERERTDGRERGKKKLGVLFVEISMQDIIKI